MITAECSVPGCERPFKARGYCKHHYDTLYQTPETRRRHQLWSKYRITPEEYDDLWESQGRCCIICERSPEGQRILPVDHDHKTGRVRGILCFPCNAKLGWYENNAAVIKWYLGGRR